MTSLIQTQGRYFWKDGQRFLIRGVVYRLHGKDANDSDPLVEDRLDDLQRDLTLFQELGLNTLFIDHIASSRSHDAAMELLAKAGIYVLVSLPTSASTRDSDAGTTTTFRPYSPQLLEDCFATIDCMSQYENTLGLIVANGALSTIYSTAVAPTIKTVIRDVKKYMSTANETTGQRQLPIGYSASNGRLILKTTFDYFTAGERDETVDFFCYANFNWCGESTMHISGYDAELKTFANAHIPVFFSQYGCNLGACGRRIFQETAAIYAPAMTHIFSGGIAYEFYDNPAAAPSSSSSILGTRIGPWGYGLVRDEGAAIGVGRGLTKLPDFYRLQARLRKVCEHLEVERKVEMEEEQQQQQHRVEHAVDGDGDTRPAFERRGSEDTIEDEDEDEELERRRRELPPLSAHWRAGYALPSVADWKHVRRSLEEKMWIEVDAEEAHGNGGTPASAASGLASGSPQIVRA